MKNHKTFLVLFGAILIITVTVPWHADADPIPECSSVEFSAITPAEKSSFVDDYETSVNREYAAPREKAQSIIDSLTAKDMCSETFPRYFGNITCRAQHLLLDKYDEGVAARKEDCRTLLDHLSEPANWDKFASCNDNADSTRDFREKNLECTGDSICGEIHGLIDESVQHASSTSQAVEQMPRCLGDLYQDVYGNTASDAKDEIMNAFTVPVGW